MSRLIVSMCVLLVAGATNAAMVNFEFASANGVPQPRGVTDIVLNPSETAVINCYLTLEEGGFPVQPEVLRLMTYALSLYEDLPGDFTTDPTDIAIVGYSDDLAPGYDYNNVPGGAGAWSLTEIVLGAGPAIEGTAEYPVSDIIVHCLGPSEDYIMILTPSTELLLFAPDLVTGIDYTLGTGWTGQPLHILQRPEPATIGLLALTGLAALPLRR